MGILAIFTISAGNFEKGFYLTLECKEISNNESKVVISNISGSLAKNPSIVDFYKKWWFCYYRFVKPLGIKSTDFEFYDSPKNDQNNSLNNSTIEVYEVLQISQINYDELLKKCTETVENLKEEMITWLNNSIKDLTQIREKFVEIKTKYKDVEINPVINISKAINSKDRKILDKLPWHEWDLLKSNSPRKEIAISDDQRVVNEINISIKKHSKPRIITIFGDSGENTSNELKLQKKEKDSICKLEKISELDFIEKPSQEELVNKLRDEQGWDILIYSGHGQPNKLGIRNLEGTTLEEIDNSLRFVVENGLKIVILNCCNSLEIANQLLSYGVHLVIAMKEEVPEEVASQFLDELLTQYAHNKKSIYESVQLGRDSLEKFEHKGGKYPSAMFFPVICQNLGIFPPLYSDLFQVDEEERNDEQNTYKKILNTLKTINLKKILIASLISLLPVLGIRGVGLLEKPELKVYNRMLKLRPTELTKESEQRVLVVTVDEEDLEYIKENYPKLSPSHENIISDEMLAEVIQKLKANYPQAVIGIDIFRDSKTGKQRQKFIDLFKK
ncbi:MAG: CHASE2 domain-containing protein [Geminocystis sp. GBBB08]|nr:CHASE2 domain-containing protein [Geminocystis sp. GBBB08]